MAPPNIPLAEVMPATWVPCWAAAMPMFTTEPASEAGSYTERSVTTTNAIRSMTGVAGSSVPRNWTSRFTLKSIIGV
jgi:hypothetical protein